MGREKEEETRSRRKQCACVVCLRRCCPVCVPVVCACYCGVLLSVCVCVLSAV